MSKSDLIMHNRHEKSTGMEIIKRLIGLRLIAQAEDPADKRSKILSLTAEGLKEVGQSYARVNIAYHLITGNLSDTDKMALNRLLGRLELYHQVLAAKTRNESFEVIVKSALSR
jgi:DNA-binding MarR family transcriptional regulator